MSAARAVLSVDQLTRIVERSSTIRERHKGPFVPVETGAKVVAERLDAWSDAVAGGNEERFAQRLSWDGLDIDGARRLVHDVRLVEGVPLPAWAELLGELAEAVASAGAFRTVPRRSGTPGAGWNQVVINWGA